MGNVVPVWPTKVTVVCITATLTGWGLGWRSGYGTALLVGGSRDRSPVTGDQTVPCALGVDSASKNEYQDIPGRKDGRCVRVPSV